jgi:mRNA interferase MazF
MNRGEIFLANLNPSRGSEQSGIRPVIVIQRNTIGKFTRTALVVPLSSNTRRSNIPGTILIPAGESGLIQDSVALCYQTVVLDQERFIRKLGDLPQLHLEMLRQALIYTMELESLE